MAHPDRQTLVAKLNHEHQALMALLEDIDEATMTRQVTHRDGWQSIGDVIKHLEAGERGMLIVIRRCIAGKPLPDYAGFDLDQYNQRQVAKRAHLTATQALAQYNAVREETLRTLTSLTEADLVQPARHPVWGEVTVAQLFRIMAIHEGLHRRDVAALIAAHK